nr:MAG TPA: hypothetical protein [Caudoviricetes sp.]
MFLSHKSNIFLSFTSLTDALKQTVTFHIKLYGII